MLTEELAVFDNLAGKLYLITHADPMQPDAYAQGHLRLAGADRATARAGDAAGRAGDGCGRAGVRIWRGRIQGGGAKGQGLHRCGRRHAGGAVAAHGAAVSRPRRCRCIARCAASILRRTCSITTWAASMSSARRPKSWCGWRATPSPCVPLPAPVRADSRARMTSAWPTNCWPTPRSVPSICSCSTWGATTPAAWPSPAASRSPRTCRSSAIRTSCTSSPTSKAS